MVGPTTTAVRKGVMGALARVMADEGKAAGRFGMKRYGGMVAALNRRQRSALPDLARISDTLMPPASRDATARSIIPTALVASVGGAGMLGAADANNPRALADGDPDLLRILDEVDGSHTRRRMFEVNLGGIEARGNPVMRERMGVSEDAMRDLNGENRAAPPILAPFSEPAYNYRRTLDATPLEPGVLAALMRERKRIEAAPMRMVGEVDPYTDTGLTPEERRARLAAMNSRR